jgi:hypothetical protein
MRQTFTVYRGSLVVVVVPAPPAASATHASPPPMTVSTTAGLDLLRLWEVAPSSHASLFGAEAPPMSAERALFGA